MRRASALGLRIEAHHEHRIGRRDVEPRRIVWERIPSAEDAGDPAGRELVEKATAHADFLLFPEHQNVPAVVD